MKFILTKYIAFIYLFNQLQYNITIFFEQGP